MNDDQLERLEKLISSKETLARMGGTPVFVRAQGYIDEAMKDLLDKMDKEKGIDTRTPIEQQAEKQLELNQAEETAQQKLTAKPKVGTFIATEFGNGEQNPNHKHPPRRV